MQLFNADVTEFSKLFFEPKHMKKPPSKVAYNWPPNFFFTGPADKTAKKRKSRTTKSP